jgi:S1-C subfamily serine protease
MASLASLFRMHPNEDLAILKFDPGAVKPAVTRVAAAGQAPRPASTCFAITSPAGNDGALTNTITQGIVSTPRRKIEDREFIQFSAAVNPGSSGVFIDIGAHRNAATSGFQSLRSLEVGGASHRP